MKFIGVSGYGWSGSGAVVDLLREFENVGTLGIEFRLIKDSYGISDLENALVKHWDILRNNKAIENFKWFTKILDMKGSRFTRVGENFSNRLFINFQKETESYLNSLIDMKYRGNSLTFNYHLSSIYLFFKKLNRINKSREMYLARPSESKFIQETQIYIENIFKYFCKKNKYEILILDQAISVTDIENSMRYIKNMKLVIVDRDPRDIYVDLIRNKALVGADKDIKQRAERFVKWYKILHQDLKEHKDVLFLKFENLVFNYENELYKIKQFLNIQNEHINKKRYFDPNISKKNIGQWKKFQYKSDIEYIYNNLKDKCYNV